MELAQRAYFTAYFFERVAGMGLLTLRVELEMPGEQVVEALRLTRVAEYGPRYDLAGKPVGSPARSWTLKILQGPRWVKHGYTAYPSEELSEALAAHMNPLRASVLASDLAIYEEDLLATVFRLGREAPEDPTRRVNAAISERVRVVQLYPL